MSYVLDANTLIAAFNGVDSVVERLRPLEPGEIILCAPVLAELEFGARLSKRREANLERIDRPVASTRYEPFDLHASRMFGEVKATLRQRGVTKTDFDLAIAMIAIATDSIMVSDDHAFHDGSIGELRAENWLSPDR